MNPKMPKSLLPAVALFHFCLPLLPAQDANSGEQPAAGTTITMSFPGGSLHDFLAHVRSLDGGINVIASELAADVPLPSIDLRQAPVLGALQSVTSIVPEPYKARAQVNSPGEGGKPVYTVAIEVQRPVKEAVEVRVFSLATITKPRPGDAAAVALEPKTVLSAVETGARFRGEPAELSYHEESQLLFVKGNPAQIELVREVLGSLEREQQRVRGEPARPRDGAGEEAPKGGRGR